MRLEQGEKALPLGIGHLVLVQGENGHIFIFEERSILTPPAVKRTRVPGESPPSQPACLQITFALKLPKVPSLQFALSLVLLVLPFTL